MAAIELHAWYRQYRKLKEEAADAILLFRFGDFYETFDDDAKLIAELLDVTLTRKEYAVDKRAPKDQQKLYAPMAGMPYHAVDRYVSELVARGYRVAIAEQLSETEAMRNDTRPRSVYAAGLTPVESSGKMVQRAIVRIITPGTVIDPAMLPDRTNNYLAAVIVEQGKVGLAYADLSTGEFAAAEFTDARALIQLQAELARLRPAEVLVPDEEALRLPNLTPVQARLSQDLAPLTKEEREALLPHERVARRLEGTSAASWTQGHVTEWPTWRWELATAAETLREQLAVASLAVCGLDERPLAARAAGALIQYAQTTQRQRVSQLRHLRVYHTGAYMLLDPQTRRNLELLESSGRQGAKASLIGVLDRTCTAMGARLLRRWITQPLIVIEPLQVRQHAVARLVAETMARLELRAALAELPDMERALNRIAQGVAVATPRDMAQLRAALRKLPAVAQAVERLLPDLLAPEMAGEPAPALDLCSDVLDLLERALDEDPPALLGASNYLRAAEEGGERPRRVIRPGFDQRLDALIKASRHAQEFIDRLENKERERTGIRSLKVGYNQVFGYYIEISRAVDPKLIPPHYERKQTLVNAERYITEELKYYEGLLSDARLKLVDLERDIFQRLCDEIQQHLDRLRTTVAAVARLDALAALAEVAVRGRYVQPALRADRVLRIKQGRHPVVERTLGEPFIGNDIELDGDNVQILIITGPNMAGKSTFLRQVALITLMAQIGSFVPADEAEIGLVDRIFTRIGAQDDIATGQSTFMVEMTETAALLMQSTPRSLIILDEVGRGTSTYDGMAIARAVVEHIHDDPRLGCRTLFATHYHELTALEDSLARVRNYHMAAVERDGRVVFLHELRRGGADRSYGIHVAELAGIPASVIRRANELLAELEGRAAEPAAQRSKAEPVRKPESPARPMAAGTQLSFFDLAPHPVVEYIRRLRIEELTPLEALNRLAELQRLADQG
ncbi:DNA mismatch repair protein MutS [Chloroflexus sp.]|uniref:DNA mismatch repair protein MutS n=2 Tax=Chloroflexus sp. TaxID=1904827 RepID=UPI00298F1603|nr:DNA mismatch repair protein MutS [Chloroflexus sp.]MDW8404422.1 DNA mismatch repair protein MutS [Chloroflexus sp.]